MRHPGFSDILWGKQGEYIRELEDECYMDSFKAFRGVFSYFQEGETVAQIACGSVNEDLFLTMERVGKEGKIILIGEEPSFLYYRALGILGEENLPEGRGFYAGTEEGRNLLKKLFSRANIEAYFQHLPPYPEQIEDSSLDHVMAINSASGLMEPRPGRPPANVRDLVAGTYGKLRKGGCLLVQGPAAEDMHIFQTLLHGAAARKRLSFEEDHGITEYLARYGTVTGHWARWIKTR